VRFTAGERVTVRGERWVVEQATAYADTTLLDLSRAHLPGPRCKLLVPFDRPVISLLCSGLRWGEGSDAHAFSEQKCCRDRRSPTER